MFTGSSLGSLTKSIGYTKSKTYQFNKFKEDSENRKRRFKKKPAGSPFLVNKESSAETFLDRRAQDTYVELSTSGAPPIWHEFHQDTLEKLNKINEICELIIEAFSYKIDKEAQKLVAKRIKIQFQDHSSLDNQINLKNAEASGLLRSCEGNLNKIMKTALTTQESEAEKKIRKNIEKALAARIQEATMLIRRQQKGLLDKLRELDDTGTISDFNIEPSAEYNELNAQEMELVDEIAQSRDAEINALVNSVNELATLFKQMNSIVIEQGTLIDRIDFNLQEAETFVDKGKKELVKAKKTMDSRCADNCIKTLYMLIVIFTIMLVLKFYKRSDE